MVKQYVVLAQLGKDVGTVRWEPQFSRHQALKFQLRPLNLIKIKEPRKVHRALRIEDLPVLKFKGLLETPGDFSTCAGVNLQPHGIAFAPAMQLRPDGLKQVAGFFLFDVKIAVSGDAERCSR